MADYISADSAGTGSCRRYCHLAFGIIPISDDDPLPRSASTVADAKMTIEQEAYAITEVSWNRSSLRLIEIQISAHGIPHLTNAANILSGQHPGQVSGQVIRGRPRADGLLPVTTSFGRSSAYPLRTHCTTHQVSS